MNRKEFMAQLERLLGELPENERLEIFEKMLDERET